MQTRTASLASALAVALVAASIPTVLALYMMSSYRKSYDVPEIDQMPDRLEIPISFRPLDMDTESDVYSTIIPNFRERFPSQLAGEERSPDALPWRKGLEGHEVTWWWVRMGREGFWAVVEYDGDRATAMHVDLDANGALSAGETLRPTRTVVHFATPTFERPTEGWTEAKLAVSLEATREAGTTEPGIEWSQTITYKGKTRRYPVGRRHTVSKIPDDPFCQRLVTEGRNVLFSELSIRGKKQWSAVAYRDGLAESVFFDVDGDGALGQGETLRPASYDVRFVLPAFDLTSTNGNTVPCRLLLHAVDRENLARCGGAVWEGPVQLGENAYRLILFDYNMNGSFSDFGEDRYTFFNEEGPIRILEEAWGIGTLHLIPTKALHPLVQLAGVNLFTIHPLALADDDSRKGSILFTRDTSDWGSVDVSLAAGPEVLEKTMDVGIVKSGRSDIRFNLDQTGPALQSVPAWAFTLVDSKISYGVENGDTWEAGLRGGTFTVTKQGVSPLPLGDLVLNVVVKGAIEEEGVPVLRGNVEFELTRDIKGAHGELYTGFRNVSVAKTYIGSKLRVQDHEGKEVIAADLKPG